MKIKLLLSFYTLMVVGILQAQDLKIGYIDADYIFSLMPEALSIEREFNYYELQLQNQLKAKYENFQAKAAAYQENVAGLVDAVRAEKEAELQRIQAEIQNFEQQAQSSLDAKRNQLMSPAYEKIGTAIKEVAKENGYTHVFSSGSPGVSIMLYAREQDNISNLVLIKLEITPPASARD